MKCPICLIKEATVMTKRFVGCLACYAHKYKIGKAILDRHKKEMSNIGRDVGHINR